ncbi:hypothetical protein [Pedobacter aquatilis]|uniref:hypothetical protein n=1 Tax=Pedobacter aquatilis TaxID=351343 RepID=UPI00292E97E6|nr:hypothetical protein [Pedobacter aquatilis]
MKAHNGMRPHDIVILLKIIEKQKGWLSKEISEELKISPSEISESLNRSSISGLLSPDKKKVMTSAFLSFLQYGLRYVFPVEPGPIERGIPTGHSADILKDYFISEETYVWPSRKGKAKGQSIAPLYPNQILAVEQHKKLYDMLALVDAIRIGKIRECEKSMELLQNLFEDNYA